MGTSCSTCSRAARRLGLCAQAGLRGLLAVYFIPGVGHGGAEYDASLAAQLDALEAWVTWRQSGGTAGSPPPAVLMGLYPRFF